MAAVRVCQVTLVALVALVVLAEAWTIPGANVQAEPGAEAQQGAELGTLGLERHLALRAPSGAHEPARAQRAEQTAGLTDNKDHLGESALAEAEAHGSASAEAGDSSESGQPAQNGADELETSGAALSSASRSAQDEPVGAGARIIKGFGGGFIG